jgi:hypothetical protein
MTKETRLEEIELRPDGWERFEEAVDAATRQPAVRRAALPAKEIKRPAQKGRAKP